MFNLTEFRKKADRMTDLLPWAALVHPGVMLNKDGSLMQVMQYRGPDIESSTPSQLVSATARLNNALKRLNAGWALFIEARREQAVAYPKEQHFPDPVSLLVDSERSALFQSEQEHFESHYYITFVYLPPKDIVSNQSKFFISETGNRKQQNSYKNELDYFLTTTRKILDILQDFMFESNVLDDESLLTYLHSCVSLKKQKLLVPETPMYLDAFIADTPLTGGLSPMLGDVYLKTISIMGFPGTSTPAILDQLNHLPIEYRWVSRYLPLDKLDAEKMLKTYRRQWFSKRKGMLSMLTEVFSKSESPLQDSAAMRNAQDADIAMEELADDHVSFGYSTFTVTVWDKDQNHAIEKAREIERVINGLGFTTICESMNAVEAWLSSIPGNTVANVRMPLIHSLNLSHLIPFSALWAGPEKNKHLNAPPLLYARTSGNTPFRLSNHINDVGHQMIIGPTGAGKSVLLSTMALQFLRYKDAQVFVFDKGGSFLSSTFAVDGHYYNVGSPDPSGLVFQPLAHINEESERIWANDWILGIISNENIEITPEIKEVVWNALNNLANFEAHQRTMTGLKALIQNQQVRLALDSYVIGGAYGHILDSDTEVFYKKNWQCFEMEELMDMPDVIPPVLSYLFHVLEKRFDGRPTMMILDEAWLFLDNPIFANKIRGWLKTLRKFNVSVIFATQSVEDTIDSDIASALIESCPSRIFLPNDRALEPNVKKHYIDLGLNETQVNILANAIPKRQYYFESPEGNALFDLALGPITLAIVASSKSEDKKKIKELHLESDHNAYLKNFFNYKNLNWVSSLMETSDD